MMKTKYLFLQVTMARRFQATVLSLLINKDQSEGIDAIKYFHEMEVTMGIVYLLLPLVSGKVDWCSIKFSASQVYEASNKDTKHCHSCKEVDLLQTKDGPLCRCMLKNSIVCTPHNMELYAVTGFLELNATSQLHLRDGSAVTYISYFKTRYKFVLSVLICMHLFLSYLHLYLYVLIVCFSRYGLGLTHKNQPLLAASKLVEVRNFLHKRHYHENKKGFILAFCKYSF
jgi:endoribonuclease Dicer